MASTRRSGGRTCTRCCWCAISGIDPASARARNAIDLVRENVTWGPEFGNSPFFEGEVEPCINGRVVALGAYFGERSDRLVDRLLGEQLADGGWNCEAERGSVRSSFHTTICVLEGLLAFEQAFGADVGGDRSAEARARSTSSIVACSAGCRPATLSTRRGRSSRFRRSGTTTCSARSTIFARPASSPMRESRRPSRPCVERRQSDGRWLLDVRYRDTLHEELAGTVGAPNRWITLRALRVRDWYDLQTKRVRRKSTFQADSDGSHPRPERSAFMRQALAMGFPCRKRSTIEGTRAQLGQAMTVCSSDFPDVLRVDCAADPDVILEVSRSHRHADLATSKAHVDAVHCLIAVDVANQHVCAHECVSGSTLFDESVTPESFTVIICTSVTPVRGTIMLVSLNEGVSALPVPRTTEAVPPTTLVVKLKTKL